MRALVVTLMIAAAARDVAAFVPATVRHRMVGRMHSLDRAPEVKITLDVACVYYEEGPSCHGRLTCRPLARDGKPSDCLGAKGRLYFDIDPTRPADPYDPTRRAFGGLTFGDGTRCDLEGEFPYWYALEVPGFFGRYSCTDGTDAPVDSGTFGVRTQSVGKKFYRYD